MGIVYYLIQVELKFSSPDNDTTEQIKNDESKDDHEEFEFEIIGSNESIE